MWLLPSKIQAPPNKVYLRYPNVQPESYRESCPLNEMLVDNKGGSREPVNPFIMLAVSVPVSCYL